MFLDGRAKNLEHKVNEERNEDKRELNHKEYREMREEKVFTGNFAGFVQLKKRIKGKNGVV